MRTIWSLVFLAIAAPAMPSLMLAQARTEWVRSVAGGWTREMAGDLDTGRPGGHVELMLARVTGSVGIRVEAMYHRLSSPGVTTCLDGYGCTEVANRYSVTSLAASLTRDLTAGRTRVYATGGAGVYHYVGVRQDDFRPCSGCPQPAIDQQRTFTGHSSLHAGVSGGVGVRYDGHPLAVFVEARYHRLLGGGPDRALLPVSVGVSF